ncbi:MAG: NADH-quinone oxidoreductase subunit NuoH [Candidatus Kapabacteria bacterium]|nr:NADH-quinone oxidoreductase subunit NuoH [Ignavibacteriota bacterium]MCW5885594.1 NADH-quinone oxidoreductase subunit NuoH [Candidatus Kapabacteria bacterium]
MEQNFIYNLFGDGIITYSLFVIIPLTFLLIYALVAILGELKIASWVQDRLGPMRTGWKGVLQPLAEVVKLLQKEDIVPDKANKPLFNLAPYVMFTGAFAAFAAIPFAFNFVPAHLNIGLFYIFAVGAFGVIGIVMGGWASNNKYSLLGAMRGVSQMVSYEIPIALAILAIAALAGSLDLQVIIHQQSGGLWNWNIFGGSGPIWKVVIIPFTLALFIIHFVGGLAETNRIPFDIPEGESEIVAGYHTEYSGMKFAMFFFAEYANMFTVSALIAIAFLGGWQSPFGDFLNQPFMQPVWFIGKACFLVFVQIWLRWTLPRLRVDQLMYVSWKVMTPLAFVCFVAIAAWSMINYIYFTPGL